MRRALALAERGRGLVEPNPLVGAVVVRDDRGIAEGWHERYGEAHAEVNALRAAKEEARGASLYITLEPCCHHGKTPPCTDAIVRAGIKRVVAAMRDPFSQVAGAGLGRLKSAGVAVTVGVEETAARRLNAPYLKLLATGRPYVHAKWAMTLDGKIATRSGESKWISNEASRRRAHELRGRMDALIIGSGTALADNPLLTARPPGPRTPTRVVLDRRARLSPASQLARTARQTPTLIATTDAGAAALQPLLELGCEVACLPSVAAVLEELGNRHMTNVLVEGGSAVLGSFLDAHAVDEVHVFVAPILAGGREALSALGGEGARRLADALRLADWNIENLDGDLYVHGRALSQLSPRSA